MFLLEFTLEYNLYIIQESSMYNIWICKECSYFIDLGNNLLDI